MNRLNVGSIMPDLKYKCGVNEPKYSTDQINPKMAFFCDLPTKYKTRRVIQPTIAFGRRAANSLIPKTCIEQACSQKNRGGFSQKGLKSICTLL